MDAKPVAATALFGPDSPGAADKLHLPPGRTDSHLPVLEEGEGPVTPPVNGDDGLLTLPADQVALQRVHSQCEFGIAEGLTVNLSGESGKGAPPRIHEPGPAQERDPRSGLGDRAGPKHGDGSGAGQPSPERILRADVQPGDLSPGEAVLQKLPLSVEGEEGDPSPKLPAQLPEKFRHHWLGTGGIDMEFHLFLIFQKAFQVHGGKRDGCSQNLEEISTVHGHGSSLIREMIRGRGSSLGPMVLYPAQVAPNAMMLPPRAPREEGILRRRESP